MVSLVILFHFLLFKTVQSINHLKIKEKQFACKSFELIETLDICSGNFYKSKFKSFECFENFESFRTRIYN